MSVTLTSAPPVGAPLVQRQTEPDQCFAQAVRGGIARIEEIAAEWRALCDEGPCNEPFYRPEWIAAYLDAFEPKGRLLLVTVRRAGQLRAVLPLIEERIGVGRLAVTRLRGAANVHSCRYDLVHGAGDRDAVAEAAWRFLVDQTAWDAITFNDVPDGGALHVLLTLAARDRFPAQRKQSLSVPFIALPDAGEPQDMMVFMGTSGQFRRKVRSRLRKLEAKGPVTLTHCDRADPAVLERFYALEAAGWKGELGTAIACDPQTRRFYDGVAQAAARWGYLSLYTLECAGHPVAMQFGLTQGGRYFTPKAAYDETAKEYGAGHLIEHEVLRDCIARGLTEYDFLGPMTEAKAKWTSTGRSHFRCMVFAQGPMGRVLQLMLMVLFPAARRLRTKLSGMRGRR